MLTDLVSGLEDLPYERVVISGSSEYTKGNEADASLGCVKSIRLPSLPVSNSSLSGRAINFVAFYIGLIVSGFWHISRGDIVICLTDPPLSNVIARFLAVAKGAKVVNWVQDIYPETAARLGFGREDSRFIKLLVRLRNQAWRSAEVNVCIGEKMRDVLNAHGVQQDQLIVIQNWADDEALNPIAQSDNPLRAEWDIAQDEMVVGYSGNLGRAHDSVTMLEAAQSLCEIDDSHIRFLFIGGGAKLNHLKDHTSANRQSGARIETRGYRQRSELRESLSVSDVHWMSLEPQLEGLIVPSKLYGVMAVGRPIIFVGDPDGEVARVIGAAQCGKSFVPGDVEGIVEYLRLLGADVQRRYQLGANARLYCEKELTRRMRIGEWRQLVERLKG